VRLGAHCLRGLLIAGLSIDSLRCQAWTTLSNKLSGPSLDLSHEELFRLSDVQKTFIVAICEELSLTALVVLKISAKQGWKFSLWAALFGRAQKLQVLLVSMRSVRELISALRPILAKGTGESWRCENFLPELQELTLHGTYFGVGRHTCADLQQCLMLRRENGAGLQTLKLLQCIDIFENDVERLTQAVGSLEWDKYEDDFWEDDGGLDGWDMQIEGEERD
jgi:hypothetical protein